MTRETILEAGLKGPTLPPKSFTVQLEPLKINIRLEELLAPEEKDLRILKVYNSTLELLYEGWPTPLVKLNSLSSSKRNVWAKPCGQRICKQMIGKVQTKEEALNEFSELVSKHNWGELSFVDVNFERGSGKAVVRNSFEAGKSISKAPCCHFFANFIGGFVSELFAKNVMAKEEKCAGKGGSHCEFSF